MHVLEVFDPSGATEVSWLHAARLPDLAGRTIGFLSNDMWQSHRMLPALREWLAREQPDLKLLPETDFPMGNAAIDTEQTVDLLQSAGVDAVIIGNAS